MTGPQEVLRAEDVHVRLGRRDVLHGVSLAVHAGEFLGLLGPNGAGKTTLLRTLLGLLSPTSGTVSATGRVGYVPQNHHMAWDFPLSVEQVVRSGRTGLRGLLRPFTRIDATAVTHALERVGLSELAARPVAALSGGQRQRVLIARALAVEPQALLLDEPFTGLDMPAQESLLALIRGLAATDGVAIAMSTHDIGEAMDTCDSVALLRAGTLSAGPAAPATLRDAQLWTRTFGVREDSPLLRAAGIIGPDRQVAS